TENVTNNPAQDICPMWAPDNKIYFISDRDNRMNLFVVDLASKETKQLTHFTDFDIKFPSIGKDSIVFEQAGYIWRYDLATGQARTSCMYVRKTTKASRSKSLIARTRTTMRRSGRPTARSCCGATACNGCAILTLQARQ